MYVHFIHLYLKACLYQTHMYTFYLYRAPEEDIFNAKCGKMEIYDTAKDQISQLRQILIFYQRPNVQNHVKATLSTAYFLS